MVESIRDLTHDIKEVRLLLKDPSDITTKAGQYIQFEVPEYKDSDESVYRAYSMASSPSDSNIIFIGGSPGMIDACIKVLNEVKDPPENIFYDKFS